MVEPPIKKPLETKIFKPSINIFNVMDPNLKVKSYVLVDEQLREVKQSQMIKLLMPKAIMAEPCIVKSNSHTHSC